MLGVVILQSSGGLPSAARAAIRTPVQASAKLYAAAVAGPWPPRRGEGRPPFPTWAMPRRAGRPRVRGPGCQAGGVGRELAGAGLDGGGRRRGGASAGAATGRCRERVVDVPAKLAARGRLLGPVTPIGTTRTACRWRRLRCSRLCESGGCQAGGCGRG